MSATAQQGWQDANKEYLVRALADVRAVLEEGEDRPARGESDAALAAVAAEMEGPPTLLMLRDMFSLSRFELDVLLLCAGVELDGQLAGAVPAGGPTFSLALARLPEAHWSALAPTGALRRWRLLEVRDGGSLTAGALRVDERVLHFLVGVECLDERLFGLLEPLPRAAPHRLPPSHRAAAARLAGWWAEPGVAGWPLVALAGADHTAKLAVAGTVAAELGLRLGRLRAGDVPAAAADRDALAMLLQREAALSGMVLWIDARGVQADSEAGARLEALVETLGCRVALAAGESPVTPTRPVRRIDVDLPTRGEQKGLWRQALGDAAAQEEDVIERVVAQFRFDTQSIAETAEDVLASRVAGAPATDLWRACRLRTRGRLEVLAQRITPRARWENLVLPESQLEILREAAAQMRQRARVYEDWGFAEASDRGLGISALFSGPSGTGKTMAAEVLANELELDLYRIDLSRVVSKYIGETEKNLGRVFDAAETAGALLLFDEADALFGKRSEVRDSHDRYANIEVSYLLQRMESYRGVSVLTTNLKDAIDKAFLRRIRFVVQFPFPDAELRARIWAGIFPEPTPTEELDYGRLAQLNVAGGGIRNIAVNAAFRAADRRDAVSREDVLRAARSEYAKADKTISDRERRGWA